MQQIRKNEKMRNLDFRLLIKKEIEEEEENEIFYFRKEEEEEKNDKKKVKIKTSKKFNALSKDINKKFFLINKKSEQLKKLNTISLQKISREYYRLAPSKSLTFNSIQKMLKENNNNMTMNQFNNTLNINSGRSSFNLINKNKTRVNSASQKKRISKSVFHNYNKYNEKFKNMKNNIYNSENNKEIYNEKDENNISDKNLKILESLKKNKTTEKLKKFIDIDINDLYKKNKKNIVDLDKFNDSFRVQMNNTCYKLIINKHIKELNEQQRDNVLVRKTMEKIKNKLNMRINNYKNKNKNKKLILIKKYKHLENNFNNKKNNTIISSRKLNSLPDKIPKNIKLQPGKNKKFSPYQIRALYESHFHSLENEKHKQKIIKKEKKEEPKKISKINDSLMEKALRKLSYTLSAKNVYKYINDVKKEKSDSKRENECLNENKYFPMLKEAKNCIQKFDINKTIDKYKIKDNIGFMEIDLDDNELEGKILDIEAKLGKM